MQTFSPKSSNPVIALYPKKIMSAATTRVKMMVKGWEKSCPCFIGFFWEWLFLWVSEGFRKIFRKVFKKENFI